MAQITEGPDLARAEGNETVWEGFKEDEVIFQSDCPGSNGVKCHGGMLYEPARHCSRCQGTGYAIRVEKRRG